MHCMIFGAVIYLHGFFKLDLGLQTLNSIFSVFQKMEKERYSIQPTHCLCIILTMGLKDL